MMTNKISICFDTPRELILPFATLTMPCKLPCIIHIPFFPASSQDLLECVKYFYGVVSSITTILSSSSCYLFYISL